MQAKPVPNKPRILISRLSHIGDCILTIPVVNAIRDRYPDAFIAWAIEAPGDKIVSQCSAVDEVITIPKGWLKKPLKTLALRKSLRKLNFDVAIDPQSLTKSAGISWISGAKNRIGLSAPLGRELSIWMNNQLVQVDSRHVVDRSVEMLKALGIDDIAVRFDVSIPVESKTFAKNLVNEIDCKEQYFVINPGAGWASRQWCNRRFGDVAQRMGSTFGLRSLVTWFGETEEKMADEIVSSGDGFAIKAPPTKLWDLAALIQNSRFLLGCDTGPTHLAAALNVPCVTLFGTTEPEVSGPYEKDPSNPIHVCIQKYYQSGSSRERRKAANAAMLEISVEDVTTAIGKRFSRFENKVA